MAVPRKRVSKMNRNNRRMHHRVIVPHTKTCSNCGDRCLHHFKCFQCGFYKGKKY